MLRLPKVTHQNSRAAFNGSLEREADKIRVQPHKARCERPLSGFNVRTHVETLCERACASLEAARTF